MKVLILVLSADFPPYDKMIETAMNTWDRLNVEDAETVFYCGKSSKIDNDKIIYLPVKEGLFNMGKKTLAAFEWALQNKEFDYVARVHSSVYVDKAALMKHIDNLPTTDVFASQEVTAEPKWMWGGIGFIISKDVLKKIVDNKAQWRHDLMEDMAMSFVVNGLNIPYTKNIGCSIDKKNEEWLCLCYGTESYKFKDFSEIRWDNGQFFFRVKQDGQRQKDEMIMNELFKSMLNYNKNEHQYSSNQASATN